MSRSLTRLRRTLSHLHIPDDENDPIDSVTFHNKNWAMVYTGNYSRYWFCTRYFYVKADWTKPGMMILANMGFKPEDNIAVLRGVADQETVETYLALHALCGDTNKHMPDNYYYELVRLLVNDEKALLECAALPPRYKSDYNWWWKYYVSEPEKAALLILCNDTSYYNLPLRGIADLSLANIERVVQWIHNRLKEEQL